MFPISSYIRITISRVGPSVSLSEVTSSITVSRVGQVFPISSYFQDYSKESGMSVSYQ